MSLIVEDGSLPTGANSYISVSDTRVFAAARGLSLPAVGPSGDAAIEVLLITAMDYVEAEIRENGQGRKLSKAQGTQYPRTGVVIDSFAIDEDEIPTCLPQAQARLACYAYANGGALTVQSDGRVVIGERIEGAVDLKYADHGDNSPQPQFPEADRLLAPLLAGGASVGFGVSVRV